MQRFKYSRIIIATKYQNIIALSYQIYVTDVYAWYICYCNVNRGIQKTDTVLFFNSFSIYNLKNIDLHTQVSNSIIYQQFSAWAHAFTRAIYGFHIRSYSMRQEENIVTQQPKYGWLHKLVVAAHNIHYGLYFPITKCNSCYSVMYEIDYCQVVSWSCIQSNLIAIYTISLLKYTLLDGVESCYESFSSILIIQ